jgi:hypothetical protein
MKKLFIFGVLCLLLSISAISQSKKEWEKVQTINSWNVYQQFILNYPDGKYTEQAKQKQSLIKQPEQAKKVAAEVPVEKSIVEALAVSSQTNEPIELKKKRYAQDSNFSAQVGIGIIDMDFQAITFGGSLNFKPDNIPLALSPYIENFSQSDQSRTYYGANILITKKIDSHIYGGGGIGQTKWKIYDYSRNALTFNLVAGVKFRISNMVGFFAEGKFFANAETNKDTDLFNSASQNHNSSNVPDFLFDNDFFVSVGLYVKLVNKPEK